jgi:predicted AAA+ superfamily ATPase
MDLRQYLVDKKTYIKQIDVKIRRIELKPNKNIITSIVGPRRIGKTYLIYSFIKANKLEDKDYLFINFEDADISSISSDELLNAVFLHAEIYGSIPKYIFLDEVQAFPGWASIVYTLYERKQYSIVITGSSSKVLSKEIATQLRGRSFPILVLPLSFAEVLEFNGIKQIEPLDSTMISRIKNMLSEYLSKGGYPDIVFNDVEYDKFFKEYLDVLIFRDIVERGNVRNISAIRFLMNAIASSYAKEFSIHKNYSMLKSIGMKVSKKTLYAYTTYFEDAFFCFMLNKFDYSLKKSHLTNKKVYLNDTGLAAYFATLKNEKGKLMENVVLLELLRLKENERIEVYYWKNLQGREVDFVIKKEGKINELIQVTNIENAEQLEEREKRGLLAASKSLRCKKVTILTWDYEREISIEELKAKCIPLWKWLLNLE